jgi:hypothetical protein
MMGHMGITGALGRAAVLVGACRHLQALVHVIMDEARIYPGDVRYLGLCVGVGVGVGVGAICDDSREEAETVIERNREKEKERKKRVAPRW